MYQILIAENKIEYDNIFQDVKMSEELGSVLKDFKH